VKRTSISRGTTELVRYTDLSRSSPSRRTRPQQQQRRRERGEFSPRARLLMWLRFDGLCVVDGLLLPPAWWTAQHRRARGAGGTSDPVAASVTSGLAVHEIPCHRRIEDNPAWALSMGYRVPQGIDPAGVPVTTWDGRRVLLKPSGA
jgi:hypothetical protein